VSSQQTAPEAVASTPARRRTPKPARDSAVSAAKAALLEQRAILTKWRNEAETAAVELADLRQGDR
jgi:hypothetical protein